MSPNLEKVIRCTEVNCTCQCFRPGKTRVRTCDQCRHGWVAHALDKLLQPPPSSLPGTQVEVAHPGVVFDLASLVLYGATALPIRLKILLDRLLSVLTNNQVLYILETLGWTLQDYCRGYVLQGSSGDVGDRWTLVCRVEETVILQQFLRFGETRPIVELMTFQDSDANDISGPASSSKKESNIRAFIESVGPSGHLEKGILASVHHFEKGSSVIAHHFEKGSSVNGHHFEKGSSVTSHHFEKGSSVTGHHFENFPPDLSILLPFQFPSSSPLLGLAPPYRLGGLRRPEKSKQSQGQQDQSDSSRSVSGSPSGNQVGPVPVLDAVNSVGEGTGNRTGTVEPRTDRNGTIEPKHEIDGSPTRSSSWKPHSDEDQCQPTSNLHDERGQPSRPSNLLSDPDLQNPSLTHPQTNPDHHDDNNTNNSTSSCSLSMLAQRLFRVGSSPSCSASQPKGQLFPEPPPSHRKGRVCCGACGKSFYDKGTLKIHYNAVHLKIKHRCTVEGCRMVFSSLRSRNRHSANPNPRLHTGPLRQTPAPSRETHTLHTHYTTHTLHTHFDSQHTHSNSPPHNQPLNIATAVPPKYPHHQYTPQYPPLRHPGSEPAGSSSPDPHSGPMLPRPGHPSGGMTVPLSPLETQLLVPSLGEGKTLSQLHRLTLKTSSPPLPCSSLLTSPPSSPSPLTALLSPLRSSSSLPDQSEDSLGSVGGAKALLSSGQVLRCFSPDPAPKKKPRKSSMPLKIEKEVMVASEECRGEEEEEETERRRNRKW